MYFQGLNVTQGRGRGAKHHGGFRYHLEAVVGFGYVRLKAAHVRTRKSIKFFAHAEFAM